MHPSIYALCLSPTCTPDRNKIAAARMAFATMPMAPDQNARNAESARRSLQTERVTGPPKELDKENAPSQMLARSDRPTTSTGYYLIQENPPRQQKETQPPALPFAKMVAPLLN